MARVRSKGNRSTEWRLRAGLASLAISGWKVQPGGLPGNPDFVFQEDKLAVFVDGCFWHGCPCCYRRPRSRQEYWDEKVLSNQRRDQRVNAELRGQGYKVVRFWEHEIAQDTKGAVDRIRRMLADAPEQ